MAKCFNCGKSFDYEKYYGICPKCGAYNRENTPEEEHRELHERYDSAEQHAAHYDGGHGNYGGNGSMGQYNGAYGGNGPARQYNGTYGSGYYGGAAPAAKASPAGTVIFILLIIGIIFSIAMPFVYSVGKAMSLGVDLAEDVLMYDQDTGDRIDLAPAREEQTAQTLPAAAGETVSLGKNGEMTVTVEEARVIVPAGHVNDFPEGEKLVGIKVSYANDYHSYYSYWALDTIYVGYDGTYKIALDSYDMEDYRNVLEDIPIVDVYNITSGSGYGEILVFVPEEITSLDFYLESRDEENLQLLEIYQIPLEIKPGKEF